MFGTTSSADVALLSATRLSSPAAPPAPVLLQPWHVLPRMATATKGGWRIASPELMQYDTGTKYSMTVVCDLSITASSLYMSHTQSLSTGIPKISRSRISLFTCCTFSGGAPRFNLVPNVSGLPNNHRWCILNYHKYRVWSPITLDSLNQKPCKPKHTPPNDANQIVHHLRMIYHTIFHGK